MSFHFEESADYRARRYNLIYNRIAPPSQQLQEAQKLADDTEAQLIAKSLQLEAALAQIVSLQSRTYIQRAEAQSFQFQNRLQALTDALQREQQEKRHWQQIANRYFDLHRRLALRFPQLSPHSPNFQAKVLDEIDQLRDC